MILTSEIPSANTDCGRKSLTLPASNVIVLTLKSKHETGSTKVLNVNKHTSETSLEIVIFYCKLFTISC